MIRFILAAVITALASPALAQGPSLPCQAAPYRLFDFWVGTWDVYANDQLAGTNVISVEEGGCLVLEKWTSATGATGQSYNFYDPDADHWRQVWVSNGLLIDYTGAPDGPNTMALEGKSVNLQNGEAAKFRGRWALLENGTVQQTFWTYNTETEEWDVWFDGNYRRR